MAYSLTSATKKVAALNAKIRAIQGGTSASKTISILLYLIHLAQTDKEPTLTSVVSESTPHLKRGAMRDFKNIMQTQGYWDDNQWNATDSIYTFPTKSTMEFFSADSADKLRGARRDRLFINEANNIAFEAFDQLEVRTKQFVYLDWNPSSEFWYYTEVQGRRTDLELIILTYKDNEALSKEIIDSIEQRRERKNWWKVYGLGLLGEIESRIYTGWIILEDIPEEARLVKTGLDFGYTMDPSAIIDIYRYNGGFLLDEVAYTTGLGNRDIATILKNNDERTLVIADSAEPKSIDEIKAYGVPIVGAIKGPDSVRNGIQQVQELTIYVTQRSLNLIKEYRNYLWMKDKDGRYVSPNVPEQGEDHALDAVRYALSSGVSESAGVPRVHYGTHTAYGGNAISASKFPRH